MDRIAKHRPNLSSTPPPNDQEPHPAGRRAAPHAAVVVISALALGFVCIALVQYSRCSYQPMASPPWSVDGSLIAGCIEVIASESV
jgi:hypothetical protein